MNTPERWIVHCLPQLVYDRSSASLKPFCALLAVRVTDHAITAVYVAQLHSVTEYLDIFCPYYTYALSSDKFAII
ncbi:hypothetical protein BDK61_3852 [Haloarcula quadrata]|uniref:Uncharacterized protein n=1 Tax=Haloarcula quadrata TaxID=182779 RepID=A0A495QVZ1_9EURY|nr:hypothetical protein BDK61_3852 [Haloarcula quadrata]